MKRIFTCLILLALFAGAKAQADSIAPPDSNLRTLAAWRGIHLGAAVTFPSSNLALYDSTLSQQFNMLVCENAMKFGSIEPTRNTFSWTAADNIVNFAVAHNMYMRGHNLLWYQQAGFLANLSTSTPRDTFLAIIHNHVRNVVDRYKGKIYEWDVVNEAIDENQTDGSRRSFLYTLNGNSASYIDSMFVWTHQEDSTVQLVYNDYNGEGSATGGANIKKRDFIFNLVAGMKSRGIPINGVGFQSHLTVFDTAAIGANIKRYDSIGINVSITEMDVSISSSTDTTQLKSQAAAYKSVMAMCLSHPNCKTFLTWGVNDESSWHASNYPLLFKGAATMTKKLAYYGVQQAMLGTVPVAIAAPEKMPAAVRFAPGVVSGAVLFPAHGKTVDLKGRGFPMVLPPSK